MNTIENVFWFCHHFPHKLEYFVEQNTCEHVIAYHQRHCHRQRQRYRPILRPSVFKICPFGSWSNTFVYDMQCLLSLVRPKHRPMDLVKFTECGFPCNKWISLFHLLPFFALPLYGVRMNATKWPPNYCVAASVCLCVWMETENKFYYENHCYYRRTNIIWFIIFGREKNIFPNSPYYARCQLPIQFYEFIAFKR